MNNRLESVHSLAAQSYAAGVVVHGDLNLELAAYASHLVCVITRRLGESPPQGAVFAFLHGCHTNDLYLSVACAGQSERAWNRFAALYQKRIGEIASSVEHSRDKARELAESVLGHLFLPDRSGNSRIASYDGQVSLEAWLAAIIKHRAIDKRMLKSNNNEPLDFLQEPTDPASLHKIELAVRTKRYEAVIGASLEQAVAGLREEDRRLLALRYIEAVPAASIAESFGVDPTTIRRQLSRVHNKVRERVTSILATQFLLNTLAIEECLDEIVESPAYSVLQLLERSLSAGTRDCSSQSLGFLLPRGEGQITT